MIEHGPQGEGRTQGRMSPAGYLNPPEIGGTSQSVADLAVLGHWSTIFKSPCDSVQAVSCGYSAKLDMAPKCLEIQSGSTAATLRHGAAPDRPIHLRPRISLDALDHPPHLTGIHCRFPCTHPCDTFQGRRTRHRCAKDRLHLATSSPTQLAVSPWGTHPASRARCNSARPIHHL